MDAVDELADARHNHVVRDMVQGHLPPLCCCDVHPTMTRTVAVRLAERFALFAQELHRVSMQETPALQGNPCCSFPRFDFTESTNTLLSCGLLCVVLLGPRASLCGACGG